MCLAAMIDVYELEQSQVCEETVQRWCVEEHAMDMDIAVLQQVEELERRVTSASLQVKVNVFFFFASFQIDIWVPRYIFLSFLLIRAGCPQSHSRRGKTCSIMSTRL